MKKSMILCGLVVVLVGCLGSGCIKNPFAPDINDRYANADGICEFNIQQVIFQYNWNTGGMLVTNTSSKQASGHIVLWDNHDEIREGYSFNLGLNQPYSYVDHYANGGNAFVLKINMHRDGVDYEDLIKLHR